MLFDEIVNALNLGDTAGHWRELWEGSATVVGRVAPDWLDVEKVAFAADELGMAEDIRRACIESAEALLANQALLQLGRRVFALLLEAEDIFTFRETLFWPALPGELGQTGRLFYAVVMLAGLGGVLARHGVMGVPRHISIETFSDIELWINAYRDKHGLVGLDEIHWLIKHFHDRIFRLGRLQYEIKNYYLDFRIYKNTQSGEVLALAEPGQLFRLDGQYDGANGIHSPEAWTSALTETAQSVTANPVTSMGVAKPQQVTLDKTLWRLVAKQGAQALFVHIPAARSREDRMTQEACLDSYRQAEKFFPECFPDFQPSVFFTATWLLDNQFAAILPAESNIVKFQQGFYLLPYTNADDAQMMARVFGGPVTDLQNVPQKSSLQRAIAEFMKKGNRCRLGAGVRLWRDKEF